MAACIFSVPMPVLRPACASNKRREMTATLHFLCGKMAAGKSTLARQLARDHDAVLIGEDLWLQRLFPVEISTFDDYLRCSERLKRVVGPHVSGLLRHGISVVLDFRPIMRRAAAGAKSVRMR